MAPYDHETDSGAPSGAPRPAEDARGRSRRRQPGIVTCDLVKPVTAWAFAQGPPQVAALGVGRVDLYAHLSHDDALLAWPVTAALQLVDRRDQIRALRKAERRIFYLRVEGLVVMDARHPLLLQRARVSVEDLESGSGPVRRRVAGVARKTVGVGGLLVPPLLPGQRDGLILFPGAHVRDRVTLIHSKVERVEDVVLAALGGRAQAQAAPAPVLAFEDARQRAQAATSAEKKTSAS